METKLIQKIREYGIAMMSGTDNECEEILQGIISMCYPEGELKGRS